MIWKLAIPNPGLAETSAYVNVIYQRGESPCRSMPWRLD